VPGSAPEKLAKAAGRGADELVIDLEDGVAAPAKAQAREAVAAALAELDLGGVTVSVRVNAPRTPWCHEDVAAVAGAAALHSIVLPKVESAGDLAFAERLLEGVEAAAGRREPVRVLALIETAAGVQRLGEIAGASPRLEGLILGYADLATSLGRREGRWDAIRDAVLVAARAHGLQAIDGPFLGLAPDAAFTAAATLARDAGFDGKWAIHPAQVPPLVELFTPAPEEIEHARAVLAALDSADQGAIAVDGEMLDEAHRRAALSTLARAGL
jgi:citrate lyase subunit beta / citryl-CoA lyase